MLFETVPSVPLAETPVLVFGASDAMMTSVGPSFPGNDFIVLPYNGCRVCCIEFPAGIKVEWWSRYVRTAPKASSSVILPRQAGSPVLYAYKNRKEKRLRLITTCLVSYRQKVRELLAACLEELLRLRRKMSRVRRWCIHN